MKNYIAIMLATGLLCVGCTGLFSQKDYGDGVLLTPLTLKPVGEHLYKAVQTVKVEPVEVTAVPTPPPAINAPVVETNTVKITPIKITPIPEVTESSSPAASLIAGDGGCIKTNKPPVVIEDVELEPIQLTPVEEAATTELPTIVVEELELREIELPKPLSVQIWWLMLYYGLAFVAILGGIKLWNIHKANKKPAPKKRRKRRTTKKKR